MKFATGARPDHPWTRARNALVGAHPLAARIGASSSLPAAASVAGYLPRVMDQGQTSGCVGHALAAAAWTACAFAAARGSGKALPFVPSPAGIYTLARCLERLDYARPLEDSGSIPGDAIASLVSWGVRPIQPLPDRYSDVDPATVNDEPKILDLEADSASVLVGAHPISTTGLARTLEVQVALAAGYPVALSVPGGSDAFQAYTGGILDAIDAPTDHYVLLSGYERIDGNLVFRGRNSWGEGFGEGGDFLVTEAFVERSTADLYAMSVRLP